MNSELAADIKAAAVGAAPPAVAVTVAGWGPQEWMYALTAVYVVLQAAYLLWKWRREARKRG